MEFREELVLKSRRLLVVDQNRETGEVLKAVLERQATQVTSIRHWNQLRELESAEEQTVLVFRAPQPPCEHPEANRLGQLPRVVIGRVRLSDADSPRTAHSTPPLPTDRHEKPAGKFTTAEECQLDDIFEYPELIQAIEKLWDQAG